MVRIPSSAAWDSKGSAAGWLRVLQTPADHVVISFPVTQWVSQESVGATSQVTGSKVPAVEAGDTWAGDTGDAKEGADVISYLKSLHEGRGIASSATYVDVTLCLQPFALPKDMCPCFRCSYLQTATFQCCASRSAWNV